MGVPSDDTGFDVRIADIDGQIVVAVRGEIDLSTDQRLWRAIDEASSRSRRLVIDLSETTFIDSSGLAVLVRAYRHLGQKREAVVFRAPSPTARKVLGISGLDRLVTVEDPPRQPDDRRAP